MKTGQKLWYPLQFVIRSAANVARVYRFLSNARHFFSHGQRLRQYRLKREVSYSGENNTMQSRMGNKKVKARNRSSEETVSYSALRVRFNRRTIYIQDVQS